GRLARSTRPEGATATVIAAGVDGRPSYIVNVLPVRHGDGYRHTPFNRDGSRITNEELLDLRLAANLFVVGYDSDGLSLFSARDDQTSRSYPAAHAPPANRPIAPHPFIGRVQLGRE